MREENGYNVFDYDNLNHGSSLKMEHTVYFSSDPDISDLISKPSSVVQKMSDISKAAEDAAFEKIKEAFKEWEECAAITHRHDLALEYIKTPETEHSSNKWGKDQYGNYNEISNKVYKMFYRIDDYGSYRSTGTRYRVRWHIYTNNPKYDYQSGNYKVAEQERIFTDKAAAEKYMQGRIKAYSHLFTEISPPIPNKYAPAFTVNGQLLPGYTTEKMQEQNREKPSVRGQLKTLKAQQDKTAPKAPAKKRSAPELE